MKQLKIALLGLVLVALYPSIKAQNQEEALAQKLVNPLSRISALPIQHNIGLGSEVFDGATYTMSVMPMIGTEYKNFNIIHRVVFNASYLPATSFGQQATIGVSDLNYSFLYSPKKVGKVIWGIGPSITFPTASETHLGTGKWNAGASLVMVYQKNRWTFDAVFTQTASFAGDKERGNVSSLVAQTLVAYNLGKGWMLSTFPTIQANWNADKGQKWTMPLGGGISKVTFLGNLPVNIGVQYYQNAIRPDHAPKGELRFMTSFVFNK